MFTGMGLMHIGLLIMMTKELLKLSANSKLAGLPLATDMLIQADDTATAFHHPMQVMRHDQHGTT